MAMFFVAVFFYIIFGVTLLSFLGLLFGFSIPEILGNYIDEKRGIKHTQEDTINTKWAYDDVESWDRDYKMWKAGEDY